MLLKINIEFIKINRHLQISNLFNINLHARQKIQHTLFTLKLYNYLVNNIGDLIISFIFR